jgi:methylase of polypeptide subunit release factors
MKTRKEFKLFYVWQNDRPSGHCKDFIQQALHAVIEKIKHNESLEFYISFNDAIRGDTGYMDIPNNIETQISNSDIVLLDFTPVGITDKETTRSKRLINQNVAFELGYAMKAISSSRLITISNDYYGSAISDFFDVRHRKYPYKYNVGESTSTDERNNQLALLSSHIEIQIKDIVNMYGKYTPPRLHDQYVNWWNSQNQERASTYILFEGQEFWVDAQVFSPDPRLTNSTSLVSRYIPDVNGKKVLDIGTGCGVLSIICAQKGAEHIIATDIDPMAVTNATRNIKRFGLEDKIKLSRTNLFHGIEGEHDVILANLPIDPNSNTWKKLGDVDKIVKDFLEQVCLKLSDDGIALIPWASFGNLDYLRECMLALNIHYTFKIENTFGVIWYLFLIRKKPFIH